MELTESLFRAVAEKVAGVSLITCGGVSLNLKDPFARMSMIDAVKQYAGVDFATITSPENARALAKQRGLDAQPHFTAGDVLNLFFEEYVEKNLVQPTFITDYPIEISPLSKKKPNQPNFVERFELFILGREFVNAFSELNDPLDQRRRFERQEILLAQGDSEAYRMDEDFLLALEYGMPPTGGLGLGVERLIMLMTDSASIRDVMLFPTMRPIDKN
jgi:lysyl-tRNA synthetase class 2